MPAQQTLAQISDNLVYSAMAVYILAMVAYAAFTARRSSRSAAARTPALETAGAVAPPDQDRSPTESEGAVSSVPETDEKLARAAAALTVLGFCLHLAALVARGAAAQRAPWGNMYEFVIAAALMVVGCYLAFLRREPVRSFGVWVTAIAVLALGLALTVLYTSAGALVPVLNSYWLVVHVAAAIASGGVFTIGAVAVVLHRVRVRVDRTSGSRPPTGVVARYGAHLPAATVLARLSHMAHLFAFPIWTFAVIAGAIWAENSWGRYWGWDPKETWAFITWVLYAAYLHAEATPGWRGRKSAWFALGGYLAFVFNFFGVNMWITGLHSYAGI